MSILGRLSSFLKNIVFGVILWKIRLFAAPEMVPWRQNKSEDQSGGPRTNLEVFGEEVSFQYFQKTIDFPDAM